MNNFMHDKSRWLTAVLFCLALAVPGCAQSPQKNMSDISQADKIIEQASGGQDSHVGDGSTLLAAPSADAFRCYTLNNCRGKYTPGVATAQACVDLGGNSWTERNGVCVSDIGE